MIDSQKEIPLKNKLVPLAARITARAIVLFAQLITAVRGIWRGVDPANVQRIYFANHASHGDFILIWTVLPPRLREKARPVAGSDYWLKTGLKRFIGKEVFNSVLIDRNPDSREEDPIAQMSAALDEGASLILFPEGTRNSTADRLLAFKSGLYHLAMAKPNVELVPVWIANLNRVMPKGEIIPIPIVCSVTFGAPVQIDPEESKELFLERARQALLNLDSEFDLPEIIDGGSNHG